MRYITLGPQVCTEVSLDLELGATKVGFACVVRSEDSEKIISYDVNDIRSTIIDYTFT